MQRGLLPKRRRLRFVSERVYLLLQLLSLKLEFAQFPNELCAFSTFGWEVFLLGERLALLSGYQEGAREYQRLKPGISISAVALLEFLAGLEEFRLVK